MYNKIETKIMVETDQSNKRLADGEMDMVALAKSETDRETGVDADGSTGADVKVAAGKVAGDGCGFLLGEVTGTLVRTEGGGGSGEGAVCVIIVLLMLQVGRSLDRCVHRWWCKGD